MTRMTTKNGKHRDRIKGWHGLTPLKVRSNKPHNTTPNDQYTPEQTPRIKQFVDQYKVNPTMRRLVSEMGTRLR